MYIIILLSRDIAIVTTKCTPVYDVHSDVANTEKLCISSNHITEIFDLFRAYLAISPWSCRIKFGIN